MKKQAWQMIASAASNQKALDASEINTERGQIGEHSPFAAALIEGLSGDADRPPAGKPVGDGVIIATELYLYLRDRIELAPGSERQTQTPGIWSMKKHDHGEYVFLTPGHPLNLPDAALLDESQNPYRGLESFETQHKDLFFGRTAIVDRLQEFIVRNPFTVVLGASGSGKSSLVKAGLIPQLEAETDPNWMSLVIRPGKSAFAALNRALNQATDSQASYITVITDWKSRNPDTKMLLIIDQCEELITLSQDQQESHRFLSELKALITTHSDLVRVVLTLRSDFEPQLRDLALRDQWQTARFIVPAMSRSQLREAIEKPAEARVMYFEPYDLIEQLIDEVADMPGGLPLLSFALSELYLKYLDRQQTGEAPDRAINQADYQSLGGVTYSLTQRADQEYNNLGSAYEPTIKTVMLRMVAVGGGEFARRRVSGSELMYPPAKAEQVETVIARFSAARLLVEGQDEQGNRYVEPAHDALIQGWAKLQNWAKSEKNLGLQRRLTPAAFEWKTKQEKRFLWNADPYLDVLQKEVLNSPDNNWLNQVETEFVQRSVQRRQFNVRTRWGTAIAVMLGLGGLTIATWIGQNSATIGQMLANSQTAEASLQSQQVTLDALLSSLRAGKSLQELLHQIAFKPNQDQESQVVRTLRKAVYTVRETNRLSNFPGGVREVFWRNEQLLVAGIERNGTIHIWDRNAQSLAESPAPADSVSQVQFSPDGNFLAIALSNGKIRLWNWQQKRFIEWQAHQGSIASIRFSPDGTRLASAGGLTAHVWNLSGKSLQQFSHPRNPFIGVGFDKNAQLLMVTASQQSQTKRAYLLNSFGKEMNQQDIDNYGSIGDLSAVLSPNGEEVTINYGGGSSAGERSLLWNCGVQGGMSRKLGGDTITAFNRDSTQLATTGSESGTISLRGEAGTTTTQLKGYQGQVVSLNFKADSNLLAAASSDGTVRLWELTLQPLKLVKQLPGMIKTVGFRPDGQLVTQSRDGKLHWLDKAGNPLTNSTTAFPLFTALSFRPKSQQLIGTAEDGLHFVEVSGNSSKVLAGDYRGSVSFRPDGEQFATIVDNTIVVLDSSSGKTVNTFKEAGQLIKSVIWRPDDQKLLFSTLDGIREQKTVRLWDALSAEQLATPLENSPEISALSFNASGSLVAVAQKAGQVSLWYSEGTKMTTFQAQDGEIAALSLSPDSSALATVGEDGTAKLWKIGDLDDLLKQGCDRAQPYLQNPNSAQDFREMCSKIED
jgi:WD40 repeat protein